ncbi:small heat shock protein, chloroplastic-like [Tasmannia lanceolata]|uniref:small heat shock protein, chloroplastic-like n=1 Tax=Tasmannia lanceolata TaxID=3420 RepID=UPI004064A3B3
MAAMIATRRAISSELFNIALKSLVGPSTRRSFNTNGQLLDTDDDERSIDVDRRSYQSRISRRELTPRILSGKVLDPFYPSRSLSQVLNLMDQMMENPFVAASRGMGSSSRRGFDVREDDNALYLRIDMPGLDKENVMVSAEQDTLIIKGQGEKDSEEDDTLLRYSSRIDLPPKLYKIDAIKAEMKNGVLKVVVPKVKEEEGKDVFQVKIE